MMKRTPACLIFVTALCFLLSACGGGGSGQSSYSAGNAQSGGSGGSTGGSGGSTGDTPATTLSCTGYPKTVTVIVNGMQQSFTQVCVILQEFAQLTPALSVATIAGDLTGHGADNLSSYVVYARIIAQAADQGTATALASSVVINTANGSVSSTPDRVDLPQSLQVDFEVFTAPSTNLTLSAGMGSLAVDNYNSTLQLTTSEGDASLKTVQGQATVNITTGSINALLSGSSWSGAGMTATTQTGDILVSRPTGYQAAFTATADLGMASIDGQQMVSTGPPQAPAVEMAGSGAPIKLESKKGNVSVVVAQ